MGYSYSSAAVAVSVLVVALAAAASGQLSTTFYASSCPTALSTIRSAVNAAVAREPRMGASLLRLHFHDCFVQGCDASILLADNATFRGEQGAFPNVNSLRGFEVISSIKMQLEASCRQTVSCADILAVAARDSVVALGGPSYPVELGRRDGMTTNQTMANTNLHPPTTDLGNFVTSFAGKGLSPTDLVVLTAVVQQQEAATFFLGDGGQELYRGDGSGTDALVRVYAANPARFNADFAAAMVRMGAIRPLTGTQGEIRLNCSRVN
ncbi:hypothetical protein OsJ_10774 [Oryza sativa Japonica Group]|uniref:Plant heme peroxidase family profile domain-containing protein n=1 Tax=Oryza sativa subsp. japonica TaxID=39947 RepID=B9F8C9_ORYSJ|nr:hypothetical protein OsJ_10774 [Oryza sativa Japonica Group]